MLLQVGRASVFALILACASESDAGEQADDDAIDPNDPCKPGGLPSLEIGQGETAFAPLESGGSLELVHGPQGGVHVLVALHAEHIDASEELTAVLRGYLDGEPVGASYPYVNMRCNEAEGGLQSWNILLIWDAAPEQLHLQTVHIEAELTDASGTVVSACKDAIIHDPLLE
jgi:hypothetical protein